MQNNIKTITRIILIIIIIFISGTIFSFSSQDSEKSSGVSGKIAEGIINTIPKYKNITRSKKDELIEKFQKPIRKTAHFSIYAALGLSVISLTFTYDIKNKKRILITLISGVLYAISDEIHQTFIPGRSGQVTDVMIDSAGIILSILIFMGINKIYKIRTKKL